AIVDDRRIEFCVLDAEVTADAVEDAAWDLCVDAEVGGAVVDIAAGFDGEAEAGGLAFLPGPLADGGVDSGIGVAGWGDGEAGDEGRLGAAGGMRAGIREEEADLELLVLGM